VEALVALRNEVIILDNLSTGNATNIMHVGERVRLIHGSVLETLLVADLAEQADVIVHLAAAVGVQLILQRPLHSFLTNVRGTEIVLDAAHRHRRKVLLASSSEIYGKNTSGPTREDDDRVLGSNQLTRWSYGTSKAVDEILAFAYHEERGLPTVVARLFNTVGPRQTGAYGMVLPRLVAQAMSGTPLTVYGDGQQTRCFCHVDDVAGALMALLGEPRAEGDTFNIDSMEEVSIFHLAELVLQATASSSTIRLVPYAHAYEGGLEVTKRPVCPGGTRPRFSPARPPRPISSHGCCNTRNRLRVGLWRGSTGYHSDARGASGRRPRDVYDCCFRLPPRQGLRSYARPGSTTARPDGCGDYGVLKRRSCLRRPLSQGTADQSNEPTF
jgi:UDP-glucose 4-epimerase